MKRHAKWYCLSSKGKRIHFDPEKINNFVPFKRGMIVFGGFFGDEGKGKEVDLAAKAYKDEGLQLLSVRGQGSGNAGHTVVVDGKRYDFHYLTSAGLLADIMLLGPGMLIDPIRILQEAEKLPEEKRNIIMISERATIVTNLDRAMDNWCELQRIGFKQLVIGTTGSGVGPGSGNRGYRYHITFADAMKCANAKELGKLILKNPLWPKAVTDKLTSNYVEQLWEAIHKLNIVSSEEVIAKCRAERGWAVLLEVSQAVALDPLFGNGGHFTTSTPCTDVGAVAAMGLTMKDFPDGSVMVLKAYGSKVGGGPYITKFSEEEAEIAKFIDEKVGEHGVTTGRRRNLGWFDGPAVRHAIALTGANICINCMDVIADLQSITQTVKICFAYEKIKARAKEPVITYEWPYHLDEYRPLFIEIPIEGLSKNEIIAKYILAIEKVIGKKIMGYGVGPSREDYREREEAFLVK